MYPIIFNTVVSYKNGWFFKKKEKRGKGDTGKFLSIIFLKKEIFTWHHSLFLKKREFSLPTPLLSTVYHNIAGRIYWRTMSCVGGYTL